MEFANDEVFDIKYNEGESTLQFGNKKWRRKIIKKIKDNKIITIIISFCAVFIIINCVLLTRFFDIINNL